MVGVLIRFLELFYGTKSMSKAFEARGHEVRTLDIDPRHRPTYCMDIMEFEADTLGDWISQQTGGSLSTLIK